MKKCINCLEFLDLSNFHKSKKWKDGLNGKCKTCRSIESKELNLKNKDKNRNRSKILSEERKKNGYYVKYRHINKEKLKLKQKEYYNTNKEKINKQNKKYYESNKSKITIYLKEYRKINKDVIKERKSKYYLRNKDKIREYRRAYEKERFTIEQKLKGKLRSRIRMALKTSSKSASVKDLLGCDIVFYKVYLESKFTKGMSWENFGNKGWHIDHIKPCSLFDLSCPNQQKECFNYKNTEPRWATTAIAVAHGESKTYIGNLEKGNKIIL